MNRTAGWRSAALTVLVALAAGCADGSVTEPDATPTPQHLVSPLSPDLNVVARFNQSVTANVLSFGWAATWIGPQGGRIRLLDFEIEVPANAVSGWTIFSIKLPLSLGSLNRAYAEFGPHNVKFAQPVRLRMPYRGTSAEGKTPSIVWWDGTQWVRYPTRLLLDGRIETTTDHFSEFATEEFAAPGITPVGG